VPKLSQTMSALSPPTPTNKRPSGGPVESQKLVNFFAGRELGVVCEKKITCQDNQTKVGVTFKANYRTLREELHILNRGKGKPP